MTDILLRCSDERLNGIAYSEFYSRLTLARLGGIKWYLSKENLAELFEEIQFAVDHKGSREIVLVSHTDCGKYKELGMNNLEIYMNDLRETTKQIQQNFPEIIVRAYLFDSDTKQLEEVR